MPSANPYTLAPSRPCSTNRLSPLSLVSTWGPSANPWLALPTPHIEAIRLPLSFALSALLFVLLYSYFPYALLLCPPVTVSTSRAKDLSYDSDPGVWHPGFVEKKLTETHYSLNPSASYSWSSHVLPQKHLPPRLFIHVLNSTATGLPFGSRVAPKLIPVPTNVCITTLPRKSRSYSFKSINIVCNYMLNMI